MGKTNNVYILKARRKRRIKRGIVLTVIIAGVLALFVTKSDFFLIKNVNIKGNSIIKTEAILKDADSFKGENLLFIKENNVISKIKSNPYIDNVTIKRSLPKTLEIDVTEKNVAYYFKGKESFDILSSDLILLEKSNKIDDKNLIEITGLKKDDLKIGEYVASGDSFTILKTTLDELYKIQKSNKSKFKVTKVDVSSLTNMKVYFGDVMVKIGDGEDLVKKINTAIAILEDKSVNLKKGYIDVSFHGSPVIKKEKDKEKEN